MQPVNSIAPFQTSMNGFYFAPPTYNEMPNPYAQGSGLQGFVSTGLASLPWQNRTHGSGLGNSGAFELDDQARSIISLAINHLNAAKALDPSSYQPLVPAEVSNILERASNAAYALLQSADAGKISHAWQTGNAALNVFGRVANTAPFAGVMENLTYSYLPMLKTISTAVGGDLDLREIVPIANVPTPPQASTTPNPQASTTPNTPSAGAKSGEMPWGWIAAAALGLSVIGWIAYQNSGQGKSQPYYGYY